MQVASPPRMKIDDLVHRFIQVRDKKSQMKAAFEAQAAKLTELQDKIEALLLVRFEELGVTSMKTAHGTAYTSVRASASVADWDAVLTFIKDSGTYELLERRVSKTAVEQYKSAHDDLPPGINWSESRGINFLRS